MQTEGQKLERKSSFLTPTDRMNPNTPSSVIQHAVGKSIAALANTDGGHVIVGQADDLSVVGLAEDFTQITKNPGRNGFQLRLSDYIKTSLDPGWAAMGLRLHWLDHGDGDIAILEVPRSKVVVFLSDNREKENEVIYVRSGSRSEKLTGRDLAEWLKIRQASS